MIYVENDSMDAAFSFALEVYLMRERNLGGEVFLFWRTVPTLMLGCYQNAASEIDEEATRRRGVAVVRRITGGGTIYTDPNGWQFSFITRNKSFDQIDFRTYMTPIVEALADLGVQAEFSSRNDILVDGRKISGNAQYRSTGCTLHHGSILFDTDLDALAGLLTPPADKLAAKGVRSVRQRVANVAEYLSEQMSSLEFRDRMLTSLLKKTTGSYTLTQEEIARVQEIADGKFRRTEWNIGERQKYETVRSGRFEGGKVEFHLNVQDGRIAQCKIAGDFFSSGDIGVLQSALVGCPYRQEDLRSALEAIHAEGFFYRIGVDDLMRCLA